jgi:hypothetical protein
MPDGARSGEGADSMTLADLIDDWHASRPGSRARLARALHALGPVLDGCAVYSGEYRDAANMRICWDAGRGYREFPEPGDIPPDEELAELWGLPLSRDVAAPEDDERPLATGAGDG